MPEPNSKPSSEPLIFEEGPALGSPCKCTPWFPADCLTTLPPRCCVRVVKQSAGEAEQVQGEPRAGVVSSSGDQEWRLGGERRGLARPAATTKPGRKGVRLRMREVRFSVIGGRDRVGCAG